MNGILKGEAYNLKLKNVKEKITQIKFTLGYSLNDLFYLTLFYLAILYSKNKIICCLRECVIKSIELLKNVVKVLFSNLIRFVGQKMFFIEIKML